MPGAFVEWFTAPSQDEAEGGLLDAVRSFFRHVLLPLVVLGLFSVIIFYGVHFRATEKFSSLDDEDQDAMNDLPYVTGIAFYATVAGYTLLSLVATVLNRPRGRVAGRAARERRERFLHKTIVFACLVAFTCFRIVWMLWKGQESLGLDIPDHLELRFRYMNRFASLAFITANIVYLFTWYVIHSPPRAPSPLHRPSVHAMDSVPLSPAMTL